MPRSTTAWLMASVSVAFSAINPIQMNSRLIALNIGFVLSCFGASKKRLTRAPAHGSSFTMCRGRHQCLFGFAAGWFFILQQDLFLQDEIQLRVELLLIRRADDQCALLF